MFDEEYANKGLIYGTIRSKYIHLQNCQMEKMKYGKDPVGSCSTVAHSFSLVVMSLRFVSNNYPESQ